MSELEDVERVKKALRKGLALMKNPAGYWEIVDLGTGRVHLRFQGKEYTLKQVSKLKASKKGQKAAVMMVVQETCYRALQSLTDRGIKPPVALKKLADRSASYLGTMREKAVEWDEIWSQTSLSVADQMSAHLDLCPQCNEAMRPLVLRFDWLCETGKELDRRVEEELATR